MDSFTVVPAQANVNVKWNHFGTFRRFTLSFEEKKGFEMLMGKCMEMVASNDYQLAWIDEEGDPILICSECDLHCAIQYMKDGLLRLTSVKKEIEEKKETMDTGSANTGGAIHVGVVCDGCDKVIIGTRYKCITCVDYDLCSICERTNQHSTHAMIRIVDPNQTLVPWGARIRARPHPRHTRHGHHGMGHTQGTGQGPIREGMLKETMERMQKAMETQMQQNDIRSHCQSGIEFLNTVGAQVQQALSNFGIDVDYEARPPREQEKKEEEKKTEKKEEGENVEKKEEEKKTEKPEEPMDTTKSPSVVTVPDTLPSIPMIPVNTEATLLTPTTPVFVQGTISQEPVSTLTPEARLIEFEDGWVMGDMYPTQSVQSSVNRGSFIQSIPPQFADNARESYKALIRMGFDDSSGRVREAVRAHPNDVNAAVDFIYNHSI